MGSSFDLDDKCPRTAEGFAPRNDLLTGEGRRAPAQDCCHPPQLGASARGHDIFLETAKEWMAMGVSSTICVCSGARAGQLVYSTRFHLQRRKTSARQ